MTDPGPAAPLGRLGRVARWLGAPRAWIVVIVLGVLAASPCLTVGFSTDDHIMRIRFLPDTGVPGFEPSRFDLFTFARDEAQRHTCMDTGLFAWWAAPGYRLAFWRPLSSATHALDFALWPQSSMAMYAHSLLWYAMLLAALAALYRRMLPGWVGGLALLLYALDDAHGPTVGYISNRNALVMATFAIMAVWAHDRARRDGWRPGRWLAPAAMALGLLAGEGAVVGFGYLFAHAVTLERGPWFRRLRPLIPHAVLGLAWAVAYKLQGFGAHGSGIYLEPVGETTAYLSAAVVRVPVLLGAQLFGPWADFWLGYPRPVAVVVLVFVLLVVAVFVAAAWSLLRREAVARMWALGSVLACLPIAGTFPADRLLLFVGVGAMGLTAMVIADALTHADAPRGRRATAVALLVVHGVVGPLLLPVRARSMETVARSFEPLDALVPTTDSGRDEPLVVVVAPNDGLVSYLPIIRAARGQPGPAQMRLLMSTLDAVAVTRTDDRTLRLTSSGFLATAPEHMLRGASHPFVAGETVELPDVTMIVESVTDDARPAVVQARFVDSIDRPGRHWVTWRGATFVHWAPPRVGQTVTLPPVDVEAMLRQALTGDRASGRSGRGS